MQYFEKLTGQLVYVQLKTPKVCFEAAKGFEYKCSIAVDEDTADAWNEQFPKQPAKVVKTTDYAEVYKTEPLYPDEKKQYVITLRKNTMIGPKDNLRPIPEMYRPKVMLQEGSKRTDITNDIEVANGSLGGISVDLWDSPKGMVARLKNVLVTDLVEYEGNTEEYVSGSEFDDPEEETPKEVPKKPAAKKAAPAKKVQKTEPAEDQPTEEEDPF